LSEPSTEPAGASLSYQALGRRAVAWTARNLAYFDPEGLSPSERTFARKSLAELALLLVYRVRLDPAPLEEDYRAVLSHIERVFARRSYREAIARDHRAFLLYAFAYAALKLCGRSTPEYDRLVGQALDSGLPLTIERIPYRQLDLIHFLHLVGEGRRAPSFADVLPLTLLAGVPNSVELKDDDVYAVTHALFYVTDFGLRAAEWPREFDAADAASLVATLTRRSQSLGNADLTAELIASALCLGVTASPEMDSAWRFLRDAQQPDGRIAGPAGFVDEARAEELGGPAYRDWITSYHTTMVVALAALMSMRAQSEPSYPTPQRGAGGDAQRGRLLVRCRRAVSEAAGWLRGQTAHEDLAHAVRAAAGLALCGESASVNAGSGGVEERLAKLAARIDASGDGDLPWEALGADTSLLAALSLRRRGLASERLDCLLDGLAADLRPADLRECPEAYAACRLLADLGRLDRSALSEIAGRLPAAAPYIQPDEPGHEFAARLLLLTGGDAGRLGGRGVPHATTTRLTSDLIQACQDYRLADAAAIVRALALVGLGGERVTRDAVSYLLSQQRPDGAFGYFARDEEGREFEAAHMALTAAAVWALADFAASQTPAA
jgi:hypothetical protein